MQSIWFRFCLIGCLVLCLSACSRAPQDGKTHLQLSTWGSAQEMAVLNALIERFEAENPDIAVDVLHIPDNYYQKLHILIASGQAPDVIFTNSISFPVYAAHGVFRDLSGDLTASESLKADDFYASALQAFHWKTPQGEILGAIPRDVSNLVMFYNRDLFRQVDLPDPKKNWLWEDFLQTAQKLTVDDNHDGRPERFGVSFYAKPPLFWLPWIWSAGGNLLNADLTEIQIQQPEAVKGLQFYADLRNRYHVAPREVESAGTTASQLFLQQKTAMMVSGRWSVPVLREQATFDWDVVPLPVGPSGKSRVGIDASGYAVSADSPHPAESFRLIEFLVSCVAIEQVTASGLIVPARVDVANADVFLNTAQKPANSRAFVEVIDDGVPTRTPSRWNELSEILMLALQPVWDGKQSAADATRKVAPRLQPLLDVGGGRP